MSKESICRKCFHSYVCEKFNENKDANNQKCHFYNDHYVPQADVVEVRHGVWKQMLRPYEDEIVCSVCGANFNVIDNCTETFDYCPHCGAKMKGDEGE